MVEAAQVDREQIKQSLLAKQEEFWANFDTYPTVGEDASKNFIAKQTIEDGGLAITMSKYRADGVTMEQLQPFIDDPIGTGARINQKLTVEQIGEDQGCKVFHVKVKMPMVISNRSILTTVYRAEGADGFQLIINSS